MSLSSPSLPVAELVPSGLELRISPMTPAELVRWRDFESRSGDTGLSSSYLWTSLWLKHFGDLVPHRLATAYADGEVTGMCLLTKGVRQHDGPFPVQSLHLGTAGEPEPDSVCVEYNRPLTTSEHRHEFARLLFEFVMQRESWEYFSVDGVEERDAQVFVQSRGPDSYEAVPSYYCDLSHIRNATAEPWRIFGDSTRTNLRRSLRELGATQIDWAETPNEASALYEELKHYHQLRWTADGKPGVFASARFTEFHRDLLSEGVPRRATIVRARQGDKVLGLLYLLIEQNRLLFYQAGIPERQSKLSLGIVTQYLAMVEGARRGYDAFDFLGGDVQYKRALSTHHNTLVWARWRRPSVKFFVLDRIRQLKQTLRKNAR